LDVKPQATSHRRGCGVAVAPPHHTFPATYNAPPINPFPLTRIHTRKLRAARLLQAQILVHTSARQTASNAPTTPPLRHKPSQQSVHEILANSRPCRTVSQLWSTPQPSTVRSARTTVNRSSAANFLYPTSLTTKTKRLDLVRHLQLWERRGCRLYHRTRKPYIKET
jgi:hypothetical protein